MNTTVQAAKAVGAGCATIALAGVGTGVGIVFASLVSSFARNPSLKGQLFSYTILGFALTEAIALFALMMAFLILYANRSGAPLPIAPSGSLADLRSLPVSMVLAWHHRSE